MKEGEDGGSGTGAGKGGSTRHSADSVPAQHERGVPGLRAEEADLNPARTHEGRGGRASRPEDGRVGDATPTKDKTGSWGGLGGGQVVDDFGREGGRDFDVDGGLADGGGEDPADDAVLDFFVAEHGVEDLGGVDAVE